MKIEDAIKVLSGPYHFVDGPYWKEIDEAVRAILPAAEKQIPKGPYLIGQGARCGACGYELKEGDGWTCCPKCGQGIDWAALIL